MKRVAPALLCLLALAAPLAAQEGEPQPEEAPTLAVLPLRFAPEALTGAGDYVALVRRYMGGTALTGKLTGELVQSRRFRVLERERVDAIVRELNLADEGLSDPKQLPKGKVLAARYLIAGEVAAFHAEVQTRRVPYGEGRVARRVTLMIEVGLRVIDTQTSQLVAAEPVRLKLVEPISTEKGLPPGLWQGVQTTLSRRLRIAIVDAVFPIKVLRLDGAEFVIDRGRGSGLIRGDRLDVFAGSGERRELGAIEVTAVGETTARVKVISGRGITPGDECRRRARSPKQAGPTSRPTPEGW